MKNKKQERFLKRKIRTRVNLNGSAKRPRISVFKSNKSIFIQAIDDDKKATIASVSEKSLGKVGKIAKNGIERSLELGKMLAEKLVAKKVKEAVFDKGGYLYHGKVKAVAEGVREGGVKI